MNYGEPGFRLPCFVSLILHVIYYPEHHFHVFRARSALAYPLMENERVAGSIGSGSAHNSQVRSIESYK
jgi:hypothetical protein